MANAPPLDIFELERQAPGHDRCSTLHLAFWLWQSAPKQKPRSLAGSAIPRNNGIKDESIMMHLAGPCSGIQSRRSISAPPLTAWV
jgi:hypothetical protein